MRIRPRPVQKQALSALARTLAKRIKAGLVEMSTGLGKTFLAAMFAKKFKRILFVAHTDEMLKQAKAAFAKVSPEWSCSRFAGKDKDLSGRVVVAMIQTLHRHLDKVGKKDFDLVVIDEVHHSAAASYRKLIDHVKPRFLLGITATPERTDGQDIRQLLDNNVVFSRGLLEAWRLKELAPIQYFAVHDTIDFTPIPWKNGRFDRGMIGEASATQRRAAEKLKQWKLLAGKRTLAFCCTVKHAKFMHKHFTRKGVPCAVVHGKTPHADRMQARDDLEAGTIKILFSVDVYNEGLDVPNIDTVMLLRATESELIWRQQIGRGLRTAPGKTHLIVIDFVGNNRKHSLNGEDDGSEGSEAQEKHALRMARLLTDNPNLTPQEFKAKQFELMPPGCSVDLGDLYEHVLVAAQKRIDREVDREKQIDEVVRLYKEGWDTKQIGKKFGVHYGTVIKWLKKAGIDTRRGASKETIDEAVRLYVEEGWDISQIAKKFGVNRATARNWLKRSDIDTSRGASKETIDEAVRLYMEEGWDILQIAKKFGVCQTTSRLWLRKEGVNTSQKTPKETIDEWVRLYVEEGWGTSQIAKKFEVSPSGVWKWLKKEGVDIRRSRAP